MAYKPKSWQEKLMDKKCFPAILKFNPKFPCGKALVKQGAKRGDSVVLAPGTEVNALMKRVPRGKLITLNDICKKLAKKHRTKYCCTLLAGTYVTIAARAAEETKNKVPFWRTIKNNGELNEQYPGGVIRQKKLLEKEGHEIIKKGKKYFIKDFPKK